MRATCDEVSRYGSPRLCPNCIGDRVEPTLRSIKCHRCKGYGVIYQKLYQKATEAAR